MTLQNPKFVNRAILQKAGFVNLEERKGMKNEVLERIKQFAIKELKAAYSYCGSAESDNSAMLNSDDKKGGEIRIKISIVEEE